MAPQVLEHLGARTKGEDPMAIEKSTAHPAHPSTEDHDDSIEAHYASLERPHACTGGWVFVGYLVAGDDGDEVEVIEAVPCRKCVASEAQEA